jgi:MauM/NapG family ferredoxin protein
LRKLRIASQILFFALFLLSFLLLGRLPQSATFQYHWFVWLNPLVSVITAIASRHVVLPALIVGAIVLVLSVVFGRAFCGMVCPLGSIIGFSDAFILGKMRSGKRTPPRYFQRAKYVILIALAVLSVFGIVFPLFMDPISLLTRVCAIVMSPLYMILKAGTLGGFDAVALAVNHDYLAVHSVKLPLFYGIGGALLILVLALAGGFWDRRFWCQYVCPSGAFFGLLSSFALFRRHVIAEKCGACTRCVRSCPTHAIDAPSFQKTSVGECILCGDCIFPLKACGRFGFGKLKRELAPSADLKRRHVLASLVGGLLALPALRTNAMSKRDDTGRAIRPPGAVPEKEFLARCTTCGACMKACPTNAIQPCTLGDGIQRLNTPKIVARVGGCEEKCFRCGWVCPTGALRPLPFEEKRFAKIGTAVIDRHRCLAWSQNKECVVCDEVCPYNAIDPIVADTVKGRFKVPVVYEDLCIGCGMCEQQCPIEDFAAIVVYKFGENRLSKGQYATDGQKQDILKRRARQSQESIRASGEPPAAEISGGLPEGFSGSGNTSRKGGSNALPPGFQ